LDLLNVTVSSAVPVVWTPVLDASEIVFSGGRGFTYTRPHELHLTAT